MKTISIVTINQPSLSAGKRLQKLLCEFDVTLYQKNKTTKQQNNCIAYDKLDEIMPRIWKSDAIIFLLACGIVVRKIAPFLEHKTKDPAVLVVSLDLKKVIPLLSGHIGGANELSCIICKKIDGCISFTTTATDQTKTFAFDMFAKQNDMQIINIDKLPHISNRLLNNKEVKVATFASLFEKLGDKKNIKLINFDEIDEDSVIISPFKSNYTNLTLKPKIYLGIGCSLGVACKDIERAILEFVKKHHFEFAQIQNIASFEAKSDEKGLLDFAKKYKFDIKFFAKSKINSLTNDFSPSLALKFFDISGVAEPSALLCSHFKELVVKKEVFGKNITIAAAV